MFYKPNTSQYFTIFAIASFILSIYSTKDEITLGLIIIGWLSFFVSVTIFYLTRNNKKE
jgi:hypothetical protein